MKNNTIFSIGPLSVQFEKDPLTETLLDDFSYLEKTDGHPEISIIPVPNFRSPPDGCVELGDTYVNNSEAFIDDHRDVNIGLKGKIIRKLGQGGYQALIHRNSNRINLYIHYDGNIYDDQLKLLQNILRFKSRTYVYRYEGLMKNVLYNLLEPIIQIKLLENNHSFLHASGVTSQDETILFTGAGGIGKTSISSELVHHDNYKLVSDDLTIISKEGNVHPYLKSLVIYPYNVEHMNDQPNFFNNWLDAYQWNWRQRRGGKKNVRRRLKMDSFYGGNNINKDVQNISKVIYIIRCHQNEIQLESISTLELADRTATHILEELSPFTTKHLLNMHAGNTEWPSIDSLKADSKSVFTNCFDGTDILLLSVPTDIQPPELTKFVKSNILK